LENSTIEIQDKLRSPIYTDVIIRRTM